MRATFQKFASKLREKYQHHRKAAKMSQKAGISGSQPRKRKIEDAMRGKTGRPKKRIRKQTEYHSSSDESEPTSEGGFAPVNLLESDGEEEVSRDTTRGKGTQERDAESEISGASDDPESGESQSEDGEGINHGISSANRTKLSQSARKDPLLTRSKEAVQVSKDIANERLEKRARAKLRADRKEDLERGRVKDVLGLTTGDAGQTAEEEKRLRRIAQKGVVKLFNAVRAAQVKGEEAAREARKEGTVGFANREEKVNELSKQGFLELINGKKKGKPIEEG
jgi:hypothetical protein